VDLARRLLDANKDRIGHITTGMAMRGREHWVYGRAGRRCRRCGTVILRDEGRGQGGDPEGRITFWCPHCQPQA
jgi:endonuclease-8